VYILYQRFVNPTQVTIPYEAGVSLLQSGRYEPAIRYFDRAINLKSEFAGAYLMRGRAYAAANRADEAIADFTVFARFSPKDPAVLIERGLAHLGKKDYAGAIADATAAIALDPKSAPGYELRATAIRASGDGRKALADSTIALRLKPDLENYFQRAQAFQLLGQHSMAILDFDQAIALSPNQPDLYFARAKSKEALGDHVGAREDVRLGEQRRGLPNESSSSLGAYQGRSTQRQ